MSSDLKQQVNKQEYETFCLTIFDCNLAGFLTQRGERKTNLQDR